MSKKFKKYLSVLLGNGFGNRLPFGSRCLRR